MLVTQDNSLSPWVTSLISHASLTETPYATFLPHWENNAFFLTEKLRWPRVALKAVGGYLHSSPPPQYHLLTSYILGRLGGMLQSLERCSPTRTKPFASILFVQLQQENLQAFECKAKDS